MNNLEKIKIGYKTYEIIRTQENVALMTNANICYGQIMYDDRKIYLNENIKDETTLIHEVLHGVDDMYNIGLSEEQIDIMAKGLYMLLDDNNLDITTVHK